MRVILASSLEAICRVAEQLGPLREQVVFLGGAVTGLLLTDSAVPEARYTEDVDVIVSADSRSGYYRWEEALEARGFVRGREPGDPICRWIASGVIVDVMPSGEDALGFGNRWYVPAMEAAGKILLPDASEIRLVTAPYFLATKLEAFRSRGRGDYLLSRDMQDIVSVVDGRPEVVPEVAGSEESLCFFLAGEFRELLSQEAFLEALSGHLLPDAASQKRATVVEQRFRQMAAPSL